MPPSIFQGQAGDCKFGDSWGAGPPRGLRTPTGGDLALWFLQGSEKGKIPGNTGKNFGQGGGGRGGLCSFPEKNSSPGGWEIGRGLGL